MKVSHIVLLAFFLGCTTLSVAQTTAELWQVVTDKLQAASNENFFLLIGNDSGIAYTFQKGSNDGYTNVQIASASKWPTSVVIQRLFEEGILDVDTRPQDIIPWWTNDPEDPRSRVKVYHLLTFQSGFNNDASCLNNQNSISLEDCVKAIYDSGTSTEPGSTFYYGGNHLQILGFMAQNKTGIDWKTLFTSYLTEPLNMTARYGGTTNPRLAGGILSSAYDYAKLVRALYFKTHLLPETVNNMEKDRTNVTITYSPAKAFRLEWHYAFGHWVECDAAKFQPKCGTDEYYVRSSAGAFGFYPFLDRTHHYYGVLSTAGSSASESVLMFYDVKDDINAAIQSAYAAPVTSPSAAPTGANTPTNSPLTSPISTPAFTSGSSLSTIGVNSVLLAFVSLLV